MKASEAGLPWVN